MINALETTLDSDLYLGALTTHVLEHFFGNIRRIAKGDNSSTKFKKVMMNSYLEKTFNMQLGIEITNPRRTSDSGATVSASDKARPEHTFDFYLTVVHRILSNFIDFPEKLFFRSIVTTGEKYSLPLTTTWETMTDFIFYEKRDKSYSSRSTMSQKITATGGYSNYRQFKSDHQLSVAYRVAPANEREAEILMETMFNESTMI